MPLQYSAQLDDICHLRVLRAITILHMWWLLLLPFPSLHLHMSFSDVQFFTLLVYFVMLQLSLDVGKLNQNSPATVLFGPIELWDWCN